MFSCCWPQKKPQKKNKPLQQKLLEKDTKAAEVNIQIQKPLQHQQKIQIPLNKKLQEMEKYNNLQLNISISAQKYQSQQITTEVKNPIKRARLGSFQQVEKIKKKSDLWEQEAGTKILYFNHKKQEEMMFAFKIIHIKTNQNHPLTYTLNPHKHTHKIRSRPLEMSLNLIVWNKNIAQTKSSIKNIENDNYIKNVFGAYKREDKKGMKSLYDNDEINQIVELSNKCIKLEIFDRIIISCLNEKDFQQILQFCQKISQFYQLDYFSKVIFVFPQELTLSEINIILSKLLRKYLISSKLQNIVKFLGFHIQLVEGDLIEPFIIVKSNLLMNEQEIYSKQFQIKLQLAIGLLMIEINYNNFKTYEKVLDHFFIDMTVIKYLKMIQFIHKQKKDYLGKLEELNLFQANQIMQIQNSTKLQQKIIAQNEKCIIIKQKAKKRMGELFTEYRTAHTPVEQLQNSKKKEWDDDLKEQDIKVVRVDKSYEQKQLEENYNIFEELPDSQIDNASLEILAGIEFKEHD